MLSFCHTGAKELYTLKSTGIGLNLMDGSDREAFVTLSKGCGDELILSIGGVTQSMGKSLKVMGHSKFQGAWIVREVRSECEALTRRYGECRKEGKK